MPEATPAFSIYNDSDLVRERVSRGDHRGVIGGLWDQLGALQADFLKSRGLLPQHALIDVGAGSFRCGVKLIPYLDPGNYYAIDLQASLLEAGYAREVEPLDLAARFPRRNYAATGAFDVSGFRRTFDYGIAQSVFTHMPIGLLNTCLPAMAPHFRAGGQFFVTVFLAPENAAGRAFRQPRGDVTTTPDKDPFHTTLAALEGVAARAPNWRLSVIGDWDHPRNQQMLCFTRRGATG